jgi:DNA-directed RNA polymerase I and III subunit RPAC1
MEFDQYTRISSFAKLRPGQSIELEAHAHQGTGKDHAKYSPVATACYRLMPLIELLHDIYDETAEELIHLYEPGVFTLVKTDKSDPPGTKVKAKLSNPYACTMSRNFKPFHLFSGIGRHDEACGFGGGSASYFARQMHATDPVCR